MDKHEFLKKVALTLEMSIKMAEGWLDRIHPDSEEDRKKLEEYRENLHAMLEEIKDYKNGSGWKAHGFNRVECQTSESHARMVELEERVNSDTEEIQGEFL